jgi:hypothetical protein
LTKRVALEKGLKIREDG